MALAYLLDTNLVSEPIRPLPNSDVVTRLQAEAGTVAIAAVTWHELWYGVLRMPPSHKRTIIERYLIDTVRKEIPILPYDQAAAEWFAQERARLVGTGRTPAYADGQIAAIAAANNLTLVTHNTADFADFHQLPVENWFSDN